MRKLNIVIGMSGGIDSSVAAYILKKSNFNVVGITFKLWQGASRCCDISDINNAKSIAYKIGIPHYVIDISKEFEKKVVKYFIKEYLNGRTPNPCVVCNAEIKIPFLFKKLNLLGFDYVATGHYAKIFKKNKEYFLAKGKDSKKTQEYFLARVHSEYLKKILFPLGDLLKSEVKKIADEKELNLRKTESQEVCFIPANKKYYEFIIDYLKTKKDFSGKIVDKNLKELGSHNCYFKFTIGQREGLGIIDKTPYYVMNIDPKNKNVIVGKKEDLYCEKMKVKDIYFYIKKSENFLQAYVKTRYNQQERPAEIEIIGKNKAIIKFQKPISAITKGQLAVFYDNNIVLGSGWIE